MPLGCPFQDAAEIMMGKSDYYGQPLAAARTPGSGFGTGDFAHQAFFVRAVPSDSEPLTVAAPAM
jgi:hypothetical protein